MACAWRAGDEAATARRGKPAIVRPAARRWHLDLSTDGRRPSSDKRRGHGISIHVGRSNKDIGDGDGDGIFAWKELAMGHCCFISL